MLRRVLILTAMISIYSSAGVAQGWAEYVNQEERFGINFPGEPEHAEGTCQLGSGIS